MANYYTLPILLFGSLLILTSAREKVHDLEAAPSIASDYKVQAVESNSKYGYPYRIAPTLGPAIQARSDDDDDDTVLVVLPSAKPYGSRISSAEDGEVVVKKGHSKKSKIIHASRRQDSEDSSVEKQFRSYVEPKYRKYDELEADFQPRRMDINIPYSQYSYPKPSRKPPVSPIDPYLTPSVGHGDSFYPVPKIKSYPPSSYSHGGHSGPSYGAGKYDEPSHYHGSSYGGPSSYTSSGGPSSSYPTGGSSPNYSSGGGHDYENYSIKSNEPIVGSIRKRLLDYAGASDLYEGEPDYLRQVARNKYKYGNIGNDYYSYGGPVHRDSYREFPYVESKISLIKKARGL